MQGGVGPVSRQSRKFLFPAKSSASSAPNANPANPASLRRGHSRLSAAEDTAHPAPSLLRRNIDQAAVHRWHLTIGAQREESRTCSRMAGTMVDKSYVTTTLPCSVAYRSIVKSSRPAIAGISCARTQLKSGAWRRTPRRIALRKFSSASHFTVASAAPPAVPEARAATILPPSTPIDRAPRRRGNRSNP
jgi:hypothetical protein